MIISEQLAEQIATIKINTDKAVEKGFVKGEAKGEYYGALAEYDRFWDTYQENGNRVNYEYAFGNRGWVNELLKPKYNITPTHATAMFLNSQYAGDLRDLPISLDFSNCASFGNFCAYSYNLTGVGQIDTRKADSITAMFTNCTALVTIQKLILKADGSQTYGTNPFNRCDKLENIEVEGAFGQNTNFQHSKYLSKASITSIINALYSSASGKTLTLSQTAVNNAFSTSEWDALVATKSNWKFSLL